MKNALITFYSKFLDSIAISNGFSFFRHLIEGEDIFVFPKETPKESLRKQLESFDAVYCSISFFSELDYIGELIQKNWIIGGPVVEFCAEYLQKRFKCTVVDKTFEAHHKLPLSDIFTDYWHDQMHLMAHDNYPVSYNCSIGKGCNWKKCKFCNYSMYEGFCYERKNLKKIIADLKENRNGTFLIHFCISSTIPDTLRELLKSQPILEKLAFNSNIYARADKQIIEIFKSVRSLEGITVAIGLEAFSQEALNILGKGVLLKNVIALTGIIIDKGGSVMLSIMDHYPFLTFEMAKESKKTIDQLSKISQFSLNGSSKRAQGMAVYNNGITLWPSQEIAKRFSANVSPYACSSLYSDFNGVRWTCKIKEDSEPFKANRIISEYLYEKGIAVLGAEFISLKSHKKSRKFFNIINHLFSSRK